MVMMSKDEAIKLWQNEMGDKEYAYDFTGKKIKRSDYLVKNQDGQLQYFCENELYPMR